ncbi:MAG: HAD-IA family hydrolase [Gammaproteobacteria bacterium]|nr:HAD-IA family hydrolase [Gammaproteobacteria bacterium]
MKMMEIPIEAICLDLDDTLWPISPVIRRAEQVTLEWLVVNYPDIASQLVQQDMQQRLASFMESFPQYSHDMTHVRRSLLGALAEQGGHPPQVGEDAFQVFFEERNRVDLYRDVLPALEWLSARYPLVAVTNGNADLGRVGLDKFFIATVQAREVGVPKPQQKIFDVAVEKAGVPQARILHVGDDPRIDVEGAREAGMQTAWVNRKAESWPADITPPDMVVCDLQDLSLRLGRMPGSSR